MSQPSEVQLRREQSQQSQPQSARTSTSSLESLRNLGFAAIQPVLRDMRVSEEPGSDGSVTVTEESGGTKKEEGGESEGGSITLGCHDGGEPDYFPTQTIASSRVFATMMEQEGFDGAIMLAEAPSTVRLLVSWMSRDLEFEITVGSVYDINASANKKTIAMNY